MTSKTALITGATAGFGKATAERFAKEGFNLIITGRRKERLEELAQTLKNKYNTESVCLGFDVRDRDQVRANLETLSAEWRKIDVLVNNAGLALGLNALQDGDYRDWDQMIDTNVKGLLYVSEMVMPWMIANKKGHIINVGSIAGTEVYPGGNIYCASKHAVNAISKAMRIDLLKHGIKVTQVRPGLAETEFSMVRFKGDAEKADNVYKGYEPMHADDIAEVIFYVSSTPTHLNINDIELTPNAQANSYTVFKQ
ncbi:MAG: NAD(P)-dependent oxidoreductase [Marinilabiliales bacterium]|nr:MAG: NAD(P)-dependent oxidoreductase [Marinilabiliales bacterium]